MTLEAVRVVLVTTWAVCGALMAWRRRGRRLGFVALAGAAVGAGALMFDAAGHETATLMLGALLPAVGVHLLVSLPDGRLHTAAARRWVVAAYVLGLGLGSVFPQDGDGPATWAVVLWWVVAVLAGLGASNSRYRAALLTDRRRMQWVGWAIAVTVEVGLAVVALRIVLDWPAHAATVVLASTVLVPIAFAAGLHGRLVERVDRLLTQTVTLAGPTGAIIGGCVLVVTAHGRSLDPHERSLLVWAMVAASCAALAFLPLRSRLTDLAHHVVYGERHAPDEALRTWGTRLTRAIPLDELLLQLVESLRKSMSLEAAEIYAGTEGRYELVAGVPHRAAPPVELGDKERQVVARAGVSGGTWLNVWIPRLAPDKSANTRVAPIVHAGALLGLVVLTRRPDGSTFSEEDDRIVTELARQVGLALHNVQLDSALQESLEALQNSHAELVSSRLRIVSAADEERRRLERNLHDGAQQHLVAMAVKLRLAEELVTDDPVEATKVIEGLRDDLKDAIAELRALAHGIFPPLLSSGGLGEALRAAAGRSALPTTVETLGVGRYSPAIESTVYFCCVEAMQNAAKHAGASASVEVSVREAADQLVFSVSDDGVGFRGDGESTGGHGFVNMADRVGTVAGRLAVTSVPGSGTTITGTIPLRGSSW